MKIWFYALCGTTVLLVWPHFGLEGLHPFDQKRLAQLVLSFLALLLVTSTKEALIPKRLQQATIFCAISLIPSVVLAEYSLLAATEWANALGLICAIILVAQIPHADKKVFYLIVASCSAYCLLALSHLGNSLLLGIDQETVPRLPGFSNIRAFNHWQTWTLPIVGALPFFHSYLPRAPKYWLWALACLWWALLYISAGRGSALGVITASAFVLLWVGVTARPWFKTLAICCTIGFGLGIAFVMLETAMGLVGQHGDGGLVATNSSNRVAIWEMTWKMFLDNFWFGVGALHYGHQSQAILASPHNLVLLTLAENGVIAGMAILVALSSALYYLTTKTRRLSPLSLAYATSIFAATTHSFFSGIQLAPYSQLWLMLIVGALMSKFRPPKQLSSNKETSNLTDLPIPAFRITVLLACGLLIAGVTYTIINPEIPDPWANMFTEHAPRFWSHGQF